MLQKIAFEFCFLTNRDFLFKNCSWKIILSFIKCFCVYDGSFRARAVFLIAAF